MTVKELCKECERLISTGYGDKEVLISRDDEGNGFHYLFYTFMTETENIKEVLEYWGDGDAENVVLLG